MTIKPIAIEKLIVPSGIRYSKRLSERLNGFRRINGQNPTPNPNKMLINPKTFLPVG